MTADGGTARTRANGVNTGYSYDNLSRLLTVVHQISGVTRDGAAYTYDNVGNRTSKTFIQQGDPDPISVVAGYTYDNIYQLTQTVLDSSLSESYSYDDVGNRLSSLGLSPYQYDNSNHLTSTPAAGFAYDANGNTTSKTDGSGTTTYTWDYENRLVSASVPGTGTVTFAYDPFGRRILKSSASATTIYAYDGENAIEELDSSGNATARYTQGLGIDEPLSMYSSSTTSYYHADGLGSVTALTDSSGSVTASYVYDSFGNLSSSTGTLANNFRYTAGEFDAETGLYYYRARYYDTSFGRFLSEDPIEFSGGDINFYTYSSNDPVNYADPSGLCRILFNGKLIRIETNNGSQMLGPFPASNETVCNCGLKEGVYTFGDPQWLFVNGQETQLGATKFDAKRNRHQAFGSVRIPLEKALGYADIPGRSGIMIHARYPDTKDLGPTRGCIRVHDPVVTGMSRFIDTVCGADELNTFHFYNRPW